MPFLAEDSARSALALLDGSLLLRPRAYASASIFRNLLHRRGFGRRSLHRGG